MLVSHVALDPSWSGGPLQTDGAVVPLIDSIKDGSTVPTTTVQPQVHGARNFDWYGHRRQCLGKIVQSLGCIHSLGCSQSSHKMPCAGEQAHTPMVVLYVPIRDLLRQGGKVTESGIVIVSRAVPFRLVKEVCLRIPDVNHRYKFEIVEKILDHELEYEVCMTFSESPIASNYQSSRTPERLMTLLCELPNGPHDATKERHVRRLAEFVEQEEEDWERYEALFKEATEFVITCAIPEEQPRSHRDTALRYRICSWCLSQVPSYLSRCARC